jgi:hypothetical protein
MDELISEINAADLGWKASTCKLQKSHVDYGKGEDCLENDSLLQLNEENDDSDEDNLSNNEEIEEQN